MEVCVKGVESRKQSSFMRSLIKIRKEPLLYIMLLPGIIYYLVFRYAPMWGVLMAFKDYSPYMGFFRSPWVGFKHFERIFSGSDFPMIMANTIIIAIINLVFYFPMPIILSLLLNEVRRHWFKRSIQTMIYLPHFLSWVVIASIFYTFLTLDGGVVNNVLKAMGLENYNFLMNPDLFRPMLLVQVVWKECGWGTIIFLAALAGVDVMLYEAAIVDGAGRWKQLWHITLPSIRSTIVILLILRMGNFLDTGFEQIFLMISPITRSVGEVFDTFIYTSGISNGQFSYATAMGLFKSVVGLLLIFYSNRFAKRVGEEGII